jgi:hypothetical protein
MKNGPLGPEDGQYFGSHEACPHATNQKRIPLHKNAFSYLQMYPLGTYISALCELLASPFALFLVEVRREMAILLGQQECYPV